MYSHQSTFSHRLSNAVQKRRSRSRSPTRSLYPQTLTRRGQGRHMSYEMALFSRNEDSFDDLHYRLRHPQAPRDPNALVEGAPPLVLAESSPAKVRLLLDYGAVPTVNIIAAVAMGGRASVASLKILADAAEASGVNAQHVAVALYRAYGGRDAPVKVRVTGGSSTRTKQALVTPAVASSIRNSNAAAAGVAMQAAACAGLKSVVKWFLVSGGVSVGSMEAKNALRDARACGQHAVVAYLTKQGVEL